MAHFSINAIACMQSPTGQRDIQFAAHLHGNLARLWGLVSSGGGQGGKVLRQLSIGVFAVPGGEVQALAVVGQPAVVYRGGHVVHVSLLLQPFDEGEEQLPLQATLVQVVWLPANEGQLHSCACFLEMGYGLAWKGSLSQNDLTQEQLSKTLLLFLLSSASHLACSHGAARCSCTCIDEGNLASTCP